MAVTELMPPGGTMTVRWSNDQSLSAPPDTASAHADRHAVHRMAGLVIGLHVSPRASGSAAVPSVAIAPRQLRLLVRPARAPARGIGCGWRSHRRSRRYSR
ncbi:MAG: hypothetical protein ABIQ49_11965 [Gemmatimonadales bacterium]